MALLPKSSNFGRPTEYLDEQSNIQSEAKFSYEIEIWNQDQTIIRYIPEHSCIGPDDLVPGIDFYPSLHETSTRSITFSMIQLKTPIDLKVFETSLINLWRTVDKQSFMDCKEAQISIMERRLNIRLHNGFKFISEQSSVTLTAGKNGYLEFTGSLGLDGFGLDNKEDCIVAVFSLEYVFDLHVTTELEVSTRTWYGRRQSRIMPPKSRGEEKRVLLGWGSWLPNDQIESGKIIPAITINSYLQAKP